MVKSGKRQNRNMKKKRRKESKREEKKVKQQNMEIQYQRIDYEFSKFLKILQIVSDLYRSFFRFLQILLDSFRFFEILLDSIRFSKILSRSHRFLQIFPNLPDFSKSPSFFQIVSDSRRLTFQIVSKSFQNLSKFFQMASLACTLPDSSVFFQILLDSSRFITPSS